MSAPSLTRKTLLARFFRMLSGLASSPVGGRAKLMAISLIILLISANGLNVLNSYVSRDFMTAIEQKQMATFIYQALLLIGVFVMSTMAASSARFLEERLGLLWRQWLTEATLQRYMSDRVYHFIEVDHDGQYPDQRIAEDIRALTGTALSFMLMLLNSLLGIVAFAGVLLGISPMLLLVSFLYAVTGSLIALWLGKPLVALNSLQVDREADLRSELLNVRTHVEPIALLQREPVFLQRLRDRLTALVANMRHIIAVNLRLSLFTGNYNYLIQIIPSLVVAPLFIEGKADFGIIAQSALAFTVLVNAFSLVVSQFPAISSFAAVVSRLYALSQAMEHSKASPPGSALQLRADEQRIRYENLTMAGRDEEPAQLQNFNLTVTAGQRTLITSQNKQVLLHLFNTTAGIENHSSGALWRPSLEQMLFIPEKPWLPPGTLRGALECNRRLTDDHEIQQVLAQLDITPVIESVGGLDAAHEDWNNLLSIGEQKLLDIARMLLAKPRFVFLLRVRSSLSDERFERVMQLLKTSGITYINLGKDEFPEYYDQIVELFEDGAWAVRNATEPDGSAHS